MWLYVNGIASLAANQTVEFNDGEIAELLKDQYVSMLLYEVKKGNVTADDIKISAETLKKQGQVAKEADNPTMDANFQRASELVNVPDDVILDM